MIFSFLFFCFSFHRELFWKPCAYQIYAKRSSNCELTLRNEKKKQIQLLPSLSKRLFCKRDETPLIPRDPLPSFSFICSFIICPRQVSFPLVLSCTLHFMSSKGYLCNVTIRRFNATPHKGWESRSVYLPGDLDKTELWTTFQQICLKIVTREV